MSVSFWVRNIFTPEDITNPNLIVNDRPYAGWLYVGIGLIKRHKSVELSGYSILWNWIWELSDRESFAENVQTWWHKNISKFAPAGRVGTISSKMNQVILLNVERKWRMELTPQNYEGYAGRFSTECRSGFGKCIYTTLRRAACFGWVSTCRSTTARRASGPVPRAPTFFKYDKKKPVSWYFYAGVEGRALATNIFLDGNTFTDSHSVDKKYFVGDVHAGFVLVIYHVLAWLFPKSSDHPNSTVRKSSASSVPSIFSVTW